MFCPKDGSLLVPKMVRGKRVMACTTCSYVEGDAEKTKLTSATEKAKEIEIIEQSDDQDLPEIETECPECGHNKAGYWIVQTRASDEAPTKFMKCTKCGHTWRDYS